MRNRSMFVKSNGGPKIFLLLILFFGFVLRLSGIFWGIPLLDNLEKTYHPDEPKIIKGAAKFPEHVLRNTDLRYPTFYHYFLGLVCRPFRFLFKSYSNFYWFVYVIGRVCSVSMGTGTILLTFLLARKIFDKRRALLASTFICLSMYHCQNSSWATTDVPLSFWVVLFILVAQKAVTGKESTTNFILAGTIFGLSVGTKYTAVMAIIPFFIMYIYSTVRELPEHGKEIFILKKMVNLKLIFFGITALIIFLITTPGIVIHYSHFLDSIRYETVRLSQSYMPRISPVVWKNTWLKLCDAIGFPLAFLSVFGLIFPFKKRRIEEISIIVMLIAFFVYFGNSLLKRYIIMVAANGIISLFGNNRQMLAFLARISIIITIAYSLFYCAGSQYLRWDDTRTEAAHYIEEKVPRGTTVGIAYTSAQYPWRNRRWMYPKIDFKKYREVHFLHKPEIVILSSYDFVRIKKALKSDKLNANYIWDRRYNKEWYRFSPPTPEIFRFYDLLLNKQEGYALLKKFKKKIFFPIEFPPPEIRIYRRKN